MKYLIVANTIIGRTGNIGYRTKHIIDSFDVSEVAIISRSGYFSGISPNLPFKLISESLFRMLNAIRIYLWRGFPQKTVERKLFYVYFRFIYFIHRKQLSLVTAVYAIDMNPSILSFLKRKGARIILDLPIAPSNYVEKLNMEYGELLGGNPSEISSEEKSLKLADVIITPSSFVQKEVLEIRPEATVITIPFGVDSKKFSVNPTKIKDSSSLKFVCAGALSRRKGLLFLLDAWEIIHETYPDSELHLCGRIYPEVKTKILSLSSKNKIVTPGFVDVSQYFNKCHVYVFPSLMEGSSKSIYEAMACGLPSIVTFESGSIVQHEIDGLIIPKCSVMAIVDAMTLFLNRTLDYQILSNKAVENVKCYPWEKYGYLVANVIREKVNA